MGCIMERWTEEYGWVFTGGYPSREAAEKTLAFIRTINQQDKFRLLDDRTRKVIRVDPE